MGVLIWLLAARVSSLDLPMSRESGMTPLNKGMNSGNRRGVGQAITWTYESTSDGASPERAKDWRRAAREAGGDPEGSMSVKRPTAVLVHGAFADASGFGGVLRELTKGGV
jgi:hypothetical protein